LSTCSTSQLASFFPVFLFQKSLLRLFVLELCWFPCPFILTFESLATFVFSDFPSRSRQVRAYIFAVFRFFCFIIQFPSDWSVIWVQKSSLPCDPPPLGSMAPQSFSFHHFVGFHKFFYPPSRLMTPFPPWSPFMSS